jgi:hypothetical protein
MLYGAIAANKQDTGFASGSSHGRYLQITPL